MSSPDTRSITVTNDSVVVNGHDVSNMVTAVDIRVSYNTTPVSVDPDHILYSGSVVVPEVPLDGIERLRKRLGQ